MRQTDAIVLSRWRNRMLYGPDNVHSGNLSANLANANIRASGNQLFSYGPHFVLAEYLPDAEIFLINGDRDSVTTATHNRAVISELRNDSAIILPFAALQSAGISRGTIRPLDIRPDDWTTETHTATELAQVPRRHRRRTVEVDRSVAALEDMPYHESRTYDFDTGTWTPAEPGPDGRYHWTDHREVFDAANIWIEAAGVYEWTTRTHRLGDSLFTAVADGRRRAFISSFDYQEANPLYFLAELPRRHGATTVDEAITALAPAAVRHAIEQGRDVKRQGDIFAIPVDLPNAIVYGRARARARLSQWRNATARPGEVGYRRPLTARQIANMRRLERRLFREKLAAFLASAEDHRAAGRPQTPAHARAKTRRWGRDRRKRGDFGFYDPRIIQHRDEYRRRYGNRAAECLRLARTEAMNHYGLVWRPAMRDRLRQTLMIHGTAHSATEIVICPGGVTYARGTLRHAVNLEERGRLTPDHRTVKLGDQWHLMVRNTVPRAR